MLVTPGEFAEIVHEVNRLVQKAVIKHTGFTRVPVSVPWAELSGVTRVSLAGALENVRASGVYRPEDSHRLWCEDKWSEGWSYGPTLDVGARTHPNLMPWDNLPPLERAKDKIVLALIGALS